MFKMSVAPGKIVLKGSTSKTLSERFGELAKAQKNVEGIKSSQREQAYASLKNRRLAAHMAKRMGTAQQSQTPQKKTVKSRLGLPIANRLGNRRGSQVRGRAQRTAGRVRGQRSTAGSRGAGNVTRFQAGNQGQRGRHGQTRGGLANRGSRSGRGRGGMTSRGGRGRGGTSQVGQQGRRGAGRGGRGRGRGASKKPVTQEQLDSELDKYMSKTKSALNAQLDQYMKAASDK